MRFFKSKKPKTPDEPQFDVYWCGAKEVVGGIGICQRRANHVGDHADYLVRGQLYPRIVWQNDKECPHRQTETIEYCWDCNSQVLNGVSI